MINGAAWGYVYGFIAVGVLALVDLVGLKAFHSSTVGGRVASAFDMEFSTSYALVTLAASIGAAVLALYAVAFFARYRLTSRLALVLPPLFAFAMLLGAGPLTGVSLAVGVFFLCLAIWRQGFIAGVVAMWVPDLIKDSMSLLRSGSGSSVVAGVVALLFAIMPLALALLIHRRASRTASPA